MKTESRKKLVAVSAVSMSQFMAFLDGTVVNVALPTIQRDLGATLSDLQWVVDGYVLTFGAFILGSGQLASRFGRRRLFLTGVLIFVIGSLICALAAAVGVLIGGRLLQGLGAAAFVPATLALLREMFQDEAERARMIGVYAGVSTLALALGPVLGGVLAESFGWQSIFFLNLPIGVVTVALAALTIGGSSDPTPTRVDLPGQLLAVTCLGALTFALLEGDAIGWATLPVLAMFVVAAAAGISFAIVQRHSKHPMLPPALFRSRPFSTCTGIAFVNGFSMLGALFLFSLFLQHVQEYAPTAAGLRMLPAVLAISVCAPLAGGLMARVGAKALLVVGLSLNGVGLLSFGLVGADTGFAMWWPILVFIGIGVGLVRTPNSATIMNSVTQNRASAASATANTSQQVGSLFGIAVMGVIVIARMDGELQRLLGELQLPPSGRARILDAVARDGLWPDRRGEAVPRDGVPGMHAMIDQAFVSGMHTALLVGGVLSLAGALLAAVFVPHSIESGAERDVAGGEDERSTKSGTPPDEGAVPSPARQHSPSPSSQGASAGPQTKGGG